MDKISGGEEEFSKNHIIQYLLIFPKVCVGYELSKGPRIIQATMTLVLPSLEALAIFTSLMALGFLCSGFLSPSFVCLVFV